MLTVDGGVGGGQVLRTALTLSALGDEPVRIERVRGARDPPGLRPQHVAGIEALAALTGATVEGASVGAETVTFDPAHAPTGRVDVDIATAGSVTLVFDLVTPLGPVIDDPIVVATTGGTDVRWSPTVDYLARVKLPALEARGLAFDLDVARRGFYPVGGGRATLTVHPGTPTPFDLVDPGALTAASVHSHASASLEDAEVAERQAAAAEDALGGADIDVDEREVRYHDVASTGTSITAVGHLARGHKGASALGERGKPAETVGTEAARALIEAADSPAAVDRHLADQLVLPLAVAGGRLTVPRLTAHVEANVSVLGAFDLHVDTEARPDGTVALAADGSLT